MDRLWRMVRMMNSDVIMIIKMKVMIKRSPSRLLRHQLEIDLRLRSLLRCKLACFSSGDLIMIVVMNMKIM